MTKGAHQPYVFGMDGNQKVQIGIGCPKPIFKELKRIAKQEHRSISRQALLFLEAGMEKILAEQDVHRNYSAAKKMEEINQ